MTYLITLRNSCFGKRCGKSLEFCIQNLYKPCKHPASFDTFFPVSLMCFSIFKNICYYPSLNIKNNNYSVGFWLVYLAEIKCLVLN
ncbi:unnamed protein product [Porites evermanni]|uniref:Uncharacterized protein n=1 Tax=Porites evermanni TaxID=104178 RepID=A0ABN8MKC7_9CNID|nr:unnamed protein product [Porites evermanni]